MGFSTISAYLDPANWQQQPNYNYQSNASLPPPQLLPSVPVAPPLPQPHGGGGAGSIRPGSMTDRARMANIPMPETAQKCPRCESTNTKFCYFNNYSLTQPRHFCKTCRRYWTRGGALRNVPVGGGCRRNKRSSKAASSGNTSKSDPAHSETASGSTSSALPSNTSGATSILGSLSSQFPQLRFMTTPMTQLNDHYGGGEIGMNYTGGTSHEMNFPIGNNTGNYLFGGGGGLASVLSSGVGVEQWRMQQGHHHFPNFLGGFDPTVTNQNQQGGLLYQGTGGVEVASSASGYAAMADKFLNNSMLSQMALVKREGCNTTTTTTINNNNNNRDDDHHQTSLARQFLGSGQVGIGDHQQWNPSGTPAWTDLSGFSSSSTSNAL